MSTDLSSAFWYLGRGTGVVALVLLAPDDWGYSRPRAGGSRIELAARDVPDAEEAVRLCPRMALSVLRAR
jgi:hypothetical protein